MLLPFLCALIATSSSAQNPKPTMNTIAEGYLHLVLAMGQHD
jgi:hypothetical protein